MDFPFFTPDSPRVRGPVALWMPIALIGIVLASATFASATLTDTRDFAARHGRVLATRAL